MPLPEFKCCSRTPRVHLQNLTLTDGERQTETVVGDLKYLWDLIKRGPEFMLEQRESQFDLHMTRMYGLLSDSLWIYNLEIIIDVKKN